MTEMDKKPGLLAELKRRNVIRVAIAYVAVAWLVMQAGALISQALELPPVVLKVLLAIGVIGFIPALVFSWVYELTPEGLKREREVDTHESITHLTGRKLDYIVIGVLCAVVALLLVDKFVMAPRLAARGAATVETSVPADSAPKPEAAPPAPAVRAPSQASIAVLPFVDMSQAKDQEYFSDGISEELLNLLAKIPQLQVAARTSSFSFKGKEVPIPEIAKTLFVANVLEGSIRKSGNQVRITAQLVRASDGYHLWSETYDRKLDDIFKIQDEISAKVVEQLKVTLLGAAPKARTTDPQAYALYLQAAQLAKQNTPDSLRQSDGLLRKALAIDGRYAPAWNELARNLAAEASTHGSLPLKEGLAQALEAANRSLASDPEYAPAHASLGQIAILGSNDLAGGAAHYERALALDPTDLNVLRVGSILLGYLGRNEAALAIDAAVVRRDPVNVQALYNLGIMQRIAGRLDDAAATQRTVLSLSPGRGSVHAELANVLLMKGDAAGALAEIEQETSEFWKQAGLALVYHALGRKADADAALAAVISKHEKEGPFNIAYIQAFRGDADKTFEWLDKAAEYHDSGLNEIPCEPLFDKVKADPRWLPFLRRIGKAPEQLAKIEFKVTLPAGWQAEAATSPAAPPTGAKP